MRTWAFAALLGAFLVLCAAPATAETTSTTSPYATSFPLCSGGSVYLTGLVHSVQRASESEFEFNYRLTGTDEATGNSYRFNATVVGVFAGSPGGDVSVETFIRSVRLIGSGGGVSYRALAFVHVTIVDGIARASIDRFESSC
jgi:hypothetical protein